MLYKVESTLYTGVITGYDVLSGNGQSVSPVTQVSVIDNLLDLLRSDNTLKKVSLRLYARSLVYGDPERDNLYITARNYRRFYNHAIPAVKDLIDKSSDNDSINEQNTYENFQNYYRNTPDNYLYGLYCFNMPYVNDRALKTLNVARKDKSDMLHLDYTSDDPGMALQTMNIIIQIFIEEYQVLRYGETKSVVAFFEEQLNLISEDLRISEDSLTDFFVTNRVINYEEETKQVASLNTQYELNNWTLLQTRASAEEEKKELERRLGIQTETLMNNSKYLNYINELGILNTAVRNAEIFSSAEHLDIENIRSQLESKEAEFRVFMESFAAERGSVEGILGNSIVEQWLNKLLIVEQTKAELRVMESRKSALDQKYDFFSPIGSTLKRKDRKVSINEQQFFANLTALNAARLREKNVQLTSATLKVVSPAGFPMNAQPTGRRKLILMATAISLVFIIAFFILLELLDQTIKNHFRAEKFTGLQVIAGLPKIERLTYSDYIKDDLNITLKVLSNELLPLIQDGKMPKINIFGVTGSDDSSFFIRSLSDYWHHKGIKSSAVSYKSDFDNNSVSYRKAHSVTDLTGVADDREVLLVEFAPISQSNIPTSLVLDGALNIITLNSERVWKSADKKVLDKLLDRADNEHKFKIVLLNSDRSAIEDFVGMLPPYTFIRRQIYRLSHLGFTAKDDYIPEESEDTETEKAVYALNTDND